MTIVHFSILFDRWKMLADQLVQAQKKTKKTIPPKCHHQNFFKVKECPPCSFSDNPSDI
jgi:hypothetical protein